MPVGNEVGSVVGLRVDVSGSVGEEVQRWVGDVVECTVVLALLGGAVESAGGETGLLEPRWMYPREQRWEKSSPRPDFDWSQ